MTSNTVARLSILKTPPASLPAGGTASYSLAVTNNGGSATSGTVTVSDTLPTGLTFASQTAGSGSLVCTASGQVITCSGTPNIAASASVTVTYTVNVAANATGTLINSALLTARGGDPRTPANDAATPTAGNGTQGSDKLSAKSAQTVTTPASLGITKTLAAVNGSSVPAGYKANSGDVLRYEVAVANTGGQSGTTTLTETVPSNTTYSGVLATEGWSVSGGNYTQSVTVGAGVTVTKNFTVTVGSLTDGVTSISNTVATSAGTCSSCTVATNTVPRLSVSKTAPATLPSGASASYSLVVSNNGGSATSGTVTLTDTLPSGLTFSAQTAGAASLACTASGQTVTCTGTPNLAAGATVTLTYSVNVSGTATGTLINGVIFTALGGDPRTPANDATNPNAGSNTQGSDKLSAKSAQTVTVVPPPIVSKSLAAVNGNAVPAGYAAKQGDVLRYDISLQNTNAASDISTTLTETVPTNTTYTGSAEGWSCVGGAIVAGTSCTQSVTVVRSTTVTKSFTVTVGSLTDAVTSIANTVTSSAGTCSGCTVTLNTEPRLSLSKTVPASLPAGGTATYSLVITNNGGSGTSGAMTLTDTLPTGLTFASQTAGAASLSCAASGQTITCAGTPRIDVGGTVTLTYLVNVAANATGTLINSAIFTALGGDSRTPANDATNPNAGSNTQGSNKLSAKSAQAVTPPASLSITKTLASVMRSGTPISTVGYQARSGDVLQYDIAVSNSGGQSGTTTLTDTVPTNTTYRDNASANEGWSCAAGATAGTACTLSVTVGPNATSTKSFTVTVGSLTDGVTSIANNVSSSAGACATCSVSTPTEPRLAVSKTAPASLQAGGTATYSLIVTNNGGSATVGTVTLTDTLPSGLTFASQTAGSGSMTCASPSSSTITCTGTPNLTASASATLTYVVNVAANAAGSKINSVIFTSLGGDSRSPANNAATPPDGSSTQGSDLLSAKSAQTVTSGGSLSVTKTLAAVTRGGSSVPTSGYVARTGDVLRYEVAVSNVGGQSDSTTLTEVAPTNTTYTGSSEGWSLAGSNYTQSVTVGAGLTVTKTFTVTVGTLTDGVTSITNTVTSSSGTCSSCTVTTNTVPRLSISKSTPASLPAGGSASYSLVIANNGGSATSGAVTVTDSLPGGLAFASQTAGAGSLVCTASGQTVTCTGSPNIAAGASVTVSYSVNVASGATGTLVNGALLTSLGGDPRTPANNAATPSAGSTTQGSDKLSAKSAQTVASPAALSVTKTLAAVNGGALPAGYQVNAGDVLRYEIAVINTGGQLGTTTLSEIVPANTAYSGSSEGWAASGTGYSQVVNVGGNSTQTKSFTVTVGSLADGVRAISNTVSASDGVTCSPCTVTTNTVPRLSLSKTAPQTLVSGEKATYSLTVSNNGGSATIGAVTVADTLPAGLVFSSQTAGASALSCAANGQTITCTGTPNLAAGALVVLSYEVTVVATTASRAINSAILTALGGDPRTPSGAAADPGTAGASTQSIDKLAAKSAQDISVPAKLTLTKTLAAVNGGAVPTGYQVKSGDVLRYEIAVSNTGGQSGTTTLTDVVPANTSYTGAAEGWSCTSGASAGSSCTQSVTIAKSETIKTSFTVTVGALTDGVTTITNTVVGSGGAKCTSCTVVTNTVPRLAVSKTGDTVLLAGGTATYNLVVTNNGGSPTIGAVTISDTLPKGLSFSSQTSGSESLSCSASGQAVTCTGTPTLAAGANTTIGYKVDVSVTASGTLVNRATLSARGGEHGTTRPGERARDAGIVVAEAVGQFAGKHAAHVVGVVREGEIGFGCRREVLDGDR